MIAIRSFPFTVVISLVYTSFINHKVICKKNPPLESAENMLHLINWNAFKERPKRFLILDLTMLTIAVLHLLLLLFDTTYLHLRSTYLTWVPAVAGVYDPMKGIEPHRFTQHYLTAADQYFAACPQVSNRQRIIMQRLSEQMVEENPFAQARLSGLLEQVKEQMRIHTSITNSSKQAFNFYWKNACNDSEQAFYQSEIKPLIELNYWRRTGTNGRSIDYFLYVDLFFVSLYLLEFLISWMLAIRRFGKEQKILYPLYHWYDLVSCIPLQQFRLLRLLRIGVIFYRMVRSDYIRLRKSGIYRALVRYQSIVMEEVSDQVALNILSNIQAKTKLGTNRDLLEETLSSHRGEIRDVIVNNLQTLELPTLQSRQPEIVVEIAQVVMQSIAATDDYQKLVRLPLVRPVVEQLVNEHKIAVLTEQAMDAFLENWQARLKSEQMQSLLSDLIDDLLDQAIRLSLNERIQDLMEDINLQILEELKESSTAKIWRTEQKELLVERVAKREALEKKRKIKREGKP